MISGTWHVEQRFSLGSSESYIVRISSSNSYDAVISVKKIVPLDNDHLVIHFRRNSSSHADLEYVGEKLIYADRYLDSDEVRNSKLSVGEFGKQHTLIIHRNHEPGYFLTLENSPKTRYFHQAVIEMDVEQGVTDFVTNYETHKHPTRPADLPDETITIEKVYERAGIQLTIKQNSSPPIPITLANSNGVINWSDNELFDAMTANFQINANMPSWNIWLFQASRHEDSTLYGRMFDTISQPHRQGLAIFNNTLNTVGDSTDPDRAQFINRYKLRTTLHELGHCFNLVHGIEKELGFPWISSLKNDQNSSSIMNRPFDPSSTNQNLYWSNFRFTFTPDEILFLQHAPEKFIKPGSVDFGTAHGFMDKIKDVGLLLIIKTDDSKAIYEFLEPVHLEIELHNMSTKSIDIDSNILEQLDNLAITITNDSGKTKIFKPFTHSEFSNSVKSIQPGEYLSKILFISAGSNGWYIDNPGSYELQLFLYINQDVILRSNLLVVQVSHPKSPDEEKIAQDFFTKEVAIIFSLKGSYKLKTANSTLLDIADKFPNSKVSIHSLLSQLYPMLRPYKLFNESRQIQLFEPSASDVEKLISRVLNRKDEAKKIADKKTWDQIEKYLLLTK